MTEGWSTTERVTKQFLSNEDLTYKANQFISIIDEIEGSMQVLNNFAQQELSKQKGLMIEAMQQELAKYLEMNLVNNELFRDSMRTSAKMYDRHILDLNFQNLTLYIDYIPMNRDE